jgi:hypothetical protein
MMDRPRSPRSRKENNLQRTLCLVLAAVLLAPSSCGGVEDEPGLERGSASTFQNLGLLDDNPRACWAQNGATAHPTETQAIQNTLREWEEASGLRINWVGDCSAPVVNASGNDVYGEEIRILLDMNVYDSTWSWPAAGTQMIPGNGCTVADDVGTLNSSGVQQVFMWSNFPSDYVPNRSCQYNMHLLPNQARNNYLHEFGHMMGLQHEHRRDDADAQCTDAVTVGSGLHITADTDRLSVMHYVILETDPVTGVTSVKPECADIPGNWGSTGLSTGDRLGAEVLYPRELASRIVGNTVTWPKKPITIKSEWAARGIFLSADADKSMMRDISWELNGVPVGTAASLELKTLPAGNHDLSLRYQDHWLREYANSFTIEVLGSKQEYLQRSAAATAATPLWL